MPKDSSTKYYQNNIDRQQKSLWKSLQRKEKQQCCRERYKNVPEDEKQKLVEYRKNIK